MSTANTFEYPLRVTASDCTVGNHVYYSRYLDWLEAARTELFRAIGQPLARLMESGIMLPVIEAQLRYRQPARFDDRILVRLWVTEASRACIVFSAEIVNADTGALLVTATTTQVCTNHADKPQRLPPALTEALAARVRTETA
ncbi:MAG: acyl-CoA thioesterase [Verrucomicrobia bacterium]|nr:acyl-CoA thioesterase [Verrucomicrobiota bacterium]